MICYKDMTFCSFYKVCKKGKECDRALTKEVREKAIKWWGSTNAPIAMFGEQPKCMEEIDE